MGSVCNEQPKQIFYDLISLEALINGMTFQSATNQYSFHTEKAVNILKKVGVLS